MKKYILLIIPLILVSIALVPIGTLAFQQSDDNGKEDEQTDDNGKGDEQTDDSNDYYTRDIDGKTFKVYSDGRVISEETGSCYNPNQETSTLNPCDGPSPENPPVTYSSPN